MSFTTYFTVFFSIFIDSVQMLSHGTADVILEACTDFWDGADIYPLSGSDRFVLPRPDREIKQLFVFTKEDAKLLRNTGEQWIWCE